MCSNIGTDSVSTTNWLRALVAAVVATTGWIGLYYSSQPLLEHEAWRQTQTALTSYWMIKEGWQLAYQTPVLGYPWEIPLEFPIYQAIVAAIAAIGDLQLDPTGRLVSLGFLFACAWPAFKISDRLSLPPETPWLFCALLWSAPIYVFYGRNFLMETAAVFFIFSSIPYFIDLTSKSPRLSSACWFSTFTTLGLLQKTTTALPILFGLGLLLLLFYVRERGLTLPNAREFAIVAISFATPVLLAFLWFMYAGAVRAENFSMSGIHPNQGMLRDWFGGNDLRMDPGVIFLIFWERILSQNGAGLAGALVILIGFLRGSARERSLIFSSLLLMMLPSLFFIRHHHFLDYYQTANVIFLLSALAISIVALASVRAPALTLLIGAAFVVVNFYHFYHGYGRFVRLDLSPLNDSTLAVSDVIRRHTPSDSAIVVFGLMSRGSLHPISAWSSEVAYYSERKSLTVSRSVKSRVWSDPTSFIGGKELGAVVFCSIGDFEREEYERILRQISTEIRPSTFKVSDCHIWLPGKDSIVLPSGGRVHSNPAFD